MLATVYASNQCEMRHKPHRCMNSQFSTFLTFLHENSRKPGQSKITTPRKEDDLCEILSGVVDGVTLGTPVAVVVRNKDQKSTDYSEMSVAYRYVSTHVYMHTSMHLADKYPCRLLFCASFSSRQGTKQAHVRQKKNSDFA